MFQHVFLFVPPPQREKRVLLKERHRACYERTLLKRDSSQTNGISNSAYWKAATHKKVVNKTQAEVEFTPRNNALKYKPKTSKTFYRSSPPTTQAHRDSKRSL